MQLILETVPVVRDEDRQELLQVMPSCISYGWKVKRSLRELLPEVDTEGEGGRYCQRLKISIHLSSLLALSLLSCSLALAALCASRCFFCLLLKNQYAA